MKRHCKDIKKIMRMKWKLLTFTKSVTRQRQLQIQPQKPHKRGYHLFLREQVDEITGEDRKNYRSIVSRRWKEIKEDPAKLSEYNDRVRQIQNDDSLNEKMPTVKHLKRVTKTPKFVDTDTDAEQGSTAKHLKKVPKTPEFVDTDSDDSNNEQKPVVEQLQKASKTSELIDTDTHDEQEQQPQKASKTIEYSDDEQRPAVNYQRCRVMYSSEDEQEPTVKKFQKKSKVPKFVDPGPGTEDE